MKIIILAGGYGTRLGNLSKEIPKPMVKIGDKPIIWHIMKIYSHYGYKDFIISLGYKQEVIKEYFYNYNIFANDFKINLNSKKPDILNWHDESEWNISLVNTGLNTLKGARIKRLEQYLAGEDLIMATYGDGIADIDINELINFHKSHGKIFTITGVCPPSRFGELLENNGKLISFEEKPQTSTGLISGGFFVFDKKFLDYLTTDENCDLEYGVFEKLTEMGEIMVYKHPHQWACVDTERDLKHLNNLWDNGKAFWKIWNKEEPKKNQQSDNFHSQNIISQQSDLFNNIYKGKKVLITGHTGFKGSWLALWLKKLGAEVIGYSIDTPTNPNHFELLNLNITSIKGDILDKEKLSKTVKTYKPDIVFHLAAQPLVLKSYDNPIETLETNIIGTANLLESCRKVKEVKAIVNITSDKCYKNQEWIWGYKENDAMGGDDPYSASKGCAELVSNSYRKSFFNPDEYGEKHTMLLANVRAGNVIGGGDWAEDRLIPDLVKATSKNMPTLLRNPQAIRPWQHVLEPLSGYLMIGEKLLEGKKEFANDWNFGPNEKEILNVREIVTLAINSWNKINYEIKDYDKIFHEANLLKLDSSKARLKLNWASVWDSRKSIEKTINWYKNYYEKNKILSEENLNDYINDAKQLSLEWTKI